MLFKILFALAALPAVISACPVQQQESYCPGYPVDDFIQGELFNAFFDLFYNKKDVAGAYNTFVAENLIEHSPNVTDGREAGIAALTPLLNIANIQVVHKIFDYGIASVHSKFTLPGQSLSTGM